MNQKGKQRSLPQRRPPSGHSLSLHSKALCFCICPSILISDSQAYLPASPPATGRPSIWASSPVGWEAVIR